MPPQLEKNHVVPTSWQDEALARDGVSREVPCSTLKGMWNEMTSSYAWGTAKLSHCLLRHLFSLVQLLSHV